ncbi:unnamed protein product [Prunus armeniaca]
MKNLLINNNKNKLQKILKKKIYLNQCRSGDLIDQEDPQQFRIDFDIGDEADQISFKEAMESQNADKWREVMVNELKSMKNNQVWELVEPHKSQKLVGSKWVIKTKKDKDGRIEIFKAILVTKGVTQREGIDYTKTFYLVSTNDSFLIIMVLVAHCDLILHQMDVKTAFLNGEREGKRVCKGGKRAYGLQN